MLCTAILTTPALLGRRASPALNDGQQRQFADANPIMPTSDSGAEFERLFLLYMDAAYNLARLLTRNAHDAEDVVQEAYLKAFKAFPRFRGTATRPWFLTIVRNTCFSWIRDNHGRADGAEYHEELHASSEPTPEAESMGRERTRAVERCVERLSAEFREVIVLREMEELSYQEIAAITGVPPGTVMSRLSRGRARLADCLRGTLPRSFFAGREPK